MGERQMKKLILEKLMNLEILQNNRDILENKINHQNKKMEPADIAHPEDDYNPDNIENHNKDQEVSFDLDNIMSKISELQITRELKGNGKTSSQGRPNSEYIEETNAHDYVQNTLNAKPNSEYIEETDAHDYVRHKVNYIRTELNTEPNSEYIEKTNANDYIRNALNTKPNSEYIEETDAHVQNILLTKPNGEYSEETDAHDYVRNELNTESAKDEKSGQTVNLECTKISDKDHQINFDLEHVLSKSPESQNKNVQMGT